MYTKLFRGFLLLVTLAVFVWSAISPHDYPTWWMEVGPAIAGAIAVAITWKRFPLSNFMLGCIAAHAIILMVGGHYTYAQVPLFNWFKEIGLFTRNNYDKVGHFVQGLFPAIYAREILLRNNVVSHRGWLAFLCVGVVGLITALYEIIEWLVAIGLGERATDFLGTQGYVYDTQSDMFLAVLGGIIAVLLLARLHDRSMRRIKARHNAGQERYLVVG